MRVVALVQILDNHFGIDDEVHDGMFDPRDVEEQREEALRQRYNNGITSEQNEWSTITTKPCFYCDKPCHMAVFCYKANNKDKDNAKNTRNMVNFALTLHHKVDSMSIWKGLWFGSHKAHDFK